MGVLSALPIISAGNACCCLWVVTGGFVAAYLFQQNRAAPITPADGALVGLLAGLVRRADPHGGRHSDRSDGGADGAGDAAAVPGHGHVPPEARDMLERFSRGGAAGGASSCSATSSA